MHIQSQGMSTYKKLFDLHKKYDNILFLSADVYYVGNFELPFSRSSGGTSIFGYPESGEKWIEGKLNKAFLLFLPNLMNFQTSTLPF